MSHSISAIATSASLWRLLSHPVFQRGAAHDSKRSVAAILRSNGDVSLSRSCPESRIPCMPLVVGLGSKLSGRKYSRASRCQAASRYSSVVRFNATVTSAGRAFHHASSRTLPLARKPLACHTHRQLRQPRWNRHWTQSQLPHPRAPLGTYEHSQSVRAESAFGLADPRRFSPALLQTSYRGQGCADCHRAAARHNSDMFARCARSEGTSGLHNAIFWARKSTHRASRGPEIEPTASGEIDSRGRTRMVNFKQASLPPCDLTSDV